jgi:hypothetical protein
MPIYYSLSLTTRINLQALGKQTASYPPAYFKALGQNLRIYIVKSLLYKCKLTIYRLYFSSII